MLFAVVRQLRARGMGIIFISHFLDQVYEIADSITVLRNGRLIDTVPVAGLDRLKLVSMMLGRQLEVTSSAPSIPIRRKPSRWSRCVASASAATLILSISTFAKQRQGVAGLLDPGAPKPPSWCSASSAPTAVPSASPERPINMTSPRKAIARVGFSYKKNKFTTLGSTWW